MIVSTRRIKTQRWQVIANGPLCTRYSPSANENVSMLLHTVRTHLPMSHMALEAGLSTSRSDATSLTACRNAAEEALSGFLRGTGETIWEFLVPCFDSMLLLETSILVEVLATGICILKSCPSLSLHPGHVRLEKDPVIARSSDNPRR